MTERVVVLGGGSWGATLADRLARNGHNVAVWEFNRERAEALQKTRRLSFMPQLVLESAVKVTNDLGEALRDRPTVVSAVPSEHVRSTFRAVRKKGGLAERAWVVSVTKGIENNSLKRMTEVIVDEAPGLAGRVAVLAGPSHAEEVARNLPTAVVVAGPEPFRERVVGLFNAERLRVYTSTDFVGVELGGALKNVFAIGCGISDGLGMGDNTKAALMTRGLNELARLGVAAGAEVMTFFGLAGLGDLIVTCTSQHSRNRLFGEKIGQGRSVAQALSEMTMVAEGFPTAKSAKQLADRHGLDLPIIAALYGCLYEGKTAREAARDLLRRPPVEEMQHLEAFIKSRSEVVP